MKHLKLAVALLAIAALGSSATAFAGTAHTSAAQTVVNTKHTSLGTIIVNGSGQTLYLDAGDKPPHFACTGGCLQAWPPLIANGTLKAKGSAKQSLLKTVKGANGKKWVTYNGHPLYTFASDSSSNPTSGEGVNGFYVVSPAGQKVTHAPNASTTTTTTTTSSSGGGYY